MLNRTGWRTNQSMIDANLSAFSPDIRSARDAVSREPPNFFLAGQYREPVPIVMEAGEQCRYHRRVVETSIVILLLDCGTSKYDS